MKHLIIVGARGWGREIYAIAQNCIGYNVDFDIKGFLDDKKDVLDGMSGYPPILNSPENYEIKPNDVFFVALGDAHWKKHYVEIMFSKGAKFINLIHKQSTIGKNTSIGIGCVVDSNVNISCDIIIGNFVTFQGYAIIGHDVKIANYAHLGVRTFMGGYSELGEAATLQTGSIVLPHVHVGDNAKVGAGSVAIRKVKNNTTVFGIPAKNLEL